MINWGLAVDACEHCGWPKNEHNDNGTDQCPDYGYHHSELGWLDTTYMAPPDPINPSHYKSHPSGIECIEVTRWMPFPTGNAVKYLWRADLKNGVEDMKKARWYLNDMIIHNRDPWIRQSTRDKLKKVAAKDDSAVRARLFVLIANGALQDALITLDSLIGQADE